MELVYLWVQDYKNIHNQGFNFSPRFTCNYDDVENELTIKENDDYIENFFGENINVTAIVGKNGSGKSSILEIILTRMYTFSYLIFFHKNKFYIQGYYPEISCNKELIFLDNSSIDIDEYTEYNKDNKNIYTIGYITFDLFKEKKIYDNNKDRDDQIDIYKDDDFVDICIYSYENLFFNILKDNSFRMKLNIEYQKKNIYKGLFTLLSKDFLFTTFNPTKITFTIKGILLNNGKQFNVPEIYRDVKDWNKRYYDIKSLNVYAQEYFQYKNKFDIEEMLYLFNIMKYLSQAQEEAYSWLLEFDFDFLQDNNKKITFQKKELKRIHQLLFSVKARFDESFNMEEVSNDESFNMEEVSNDDFFNLNKSKKGYFSSFSEENINYLNDFFNKTYEKSFNSIDSIENISLLLELYEIGFLSIDFFDNKMRILDSLSHGERNFFILEFLMVNKILESKEENIFFLLDEIDTNFHPEWQKSILNRLQKFVTQFDKKIHFILTSHSPFLLSDIPKQNIIFLDKDEKGNCKVVDGLKEKKQTFGANIHTLLSDSFFMEDGLMGEFAKGKIDEVIKLLNKEKLDEKELKYCEQIISIIGEPIVKNQLQRMLDSKRLKKVDEIDVIKRSMEAMQKRLDELEK